MIAHRMIPKTQSKYMLQKKQGDPRAEEIYLSTIHQDWKSALDLLHQGAPCNYQSVCSFCSQIYFCFWAQYIYIFRLRLTHVPSALQAWGRTALHSALFENHVKAAPPEFFEELTRASKGVINYTTDSGNVGIYICISPSRYYTI